jgi:DNA-binding CsgD family transcriptional regulator
MDKKSPVMSVIADSTIIGLHDARTLKELAPALFKFIAEALPQKMLFLMLRPLEFELRAFCSPPELQQLCDNYITTDHKDDIWLQRSPVSPDIPVVRHSLYTPRALFHRSRFYKTVMKKIGCEYGTSLVAWRENTWLGALTIFRTVEQGDFQDDEVPVLQACHLHFQSAIRRIASLQEEKLASKSLATLIWNLPTAAIVLDWNLKVLYSNVSSQELTTEWKKGSRLAAVRSSNRFSVPKEIVTAIEERRATLVALKPNRPKSPNMIALAEVKHPTIAELTADVSFLPSKSLAISKGTFCVVYHRHHKIPGERDSYDRLANLTRRERDVVLMAASGKNSRQICKELGTSAVTVRKQLHNAYKKLGINSRFELMAIFARNPITSSGQVRAPKDHCDEVKNMSRQRMTQKLL